MLNRETPTAARTLSNARGSKRGARVVQSCSSFFSDIVFKEKKKKECCKTSAQIQKKKEKENKDGKKEIVGGDDYPDAPANNGRIISCIGI